MLQCRRGLVWLHVLVKIPLLSGRHAGVLLLMQTEKAQIRKAERGYVFEILMRWSNFLLQAQNNFLHTRETSPVVLMPLYVSLHLCVASVKAWFRVVRYVYMALTTSLTCHWRDSWPSPSTQWKSLPPQNLTPAHPDQFTPTWRRPYLTDWRSYDVKTLVFKQNKTVYINCEAPQGQEIIFKNAETLLFLLSVAHAVKLKKMFREPEGVLYPFFF